MPTKRTRVRVFLGLMYAVVAAEVVAAVLLATTRSVDAGLPWLLAALLTASMMRVFWRGFERRGPDHWLYGWRAAYRKLRG